jgi:Sap-like sulfolipid-1-addressing protein
MNAEILPLAITMMAGPQIMSAIVLVTGERPVRTSIAFVAAVGLAAGLGILLFTVLAGAFGGELSSDQDSSSPSTAAKVVQIGLVVLLILAAIKAYLGRETAEPPKWMGTLQTASPWKAFRLGALLILLMPSDVVIMLTTAVNLESNGSSLLDALPLVGATALIAALPLIVYVTLGKRGAELMPKLRDWMNRNSWLVNIFVYVLFIALILA